MSMVNCPFCNGIISDQAPKCVHCGKELRKGSFFNVKICSECGQEVDVDSKFCPSCGFPFEDQQLTQRKKRHPRKVMFAAIAVAVLIIGGGIYYNTKIVPANKYKEANKLYDKGEYKKAKKLYKSLGDYKDSKKKIDSITRQEAYDSAVALIKMAYEDCESSDTTLSDDGLSIMVDSRSKFDRDGVKDIATIISDLGFKDSVLDKMGQTNSMMGNQTESNGIYKVTWSYHPDNGLDAIFELDNY